MDYRFPRLAYGGPFKALAHTHDMNRGERGVHSPLESAADTRIRRDTEQQVCFLRRHSSVTLELLRQAKWEDYGTLDTALNRVFHAASALSVSWATAPTETQHIRPRENTRNPHQKDSRLSNEFARNQGNPPDHHV